MLLLTLKHSQNFDGLVEFISVACYYRIFRLRLLFIVNFFYSIFKGRKLEGEYNNPWGGTTLEWTAPVERIHGNWPGEIPTVYRWPYDYSVNGKDFTPQSVPLAPGEVEHK
jgi:cytochrome c oxidase subunit 1